MLHAHMDQTTQKGTRSKHHRFGTEIEPHLSADSAHALAFDDEIDHGLLEDIKASLLLDDLAHRSPIQHTVCLGTSGPHSRPLAGVENPELDTCLVCGTGHRTAQGVDFLDQVTLADTAYSRVAGHLPQLLDALGEQQRGHAHARRGKRGLGAGMAATDHDHAVVPGVFHVAAPEKGPGSISAASAGVQNSTTGNFGRSARDLPIIQGYFSPGKERIRGCCY